MEKKPQNNHSNKKHKKKGSTKQEFLRDAAKIEGVYVPSLYEVSYNEDSTLKAWRI